MEFHVGEQLGAYRITEVIGDGTWAAVYGAVHARLERKVAIKVLKPEVSQDKEVVGRFFREARTVGEINHPHIVKITDVFEESEWDPPIYYMVMEYLVGEDVYSRIQTKGPLAIEQVVTIGWQVADALGAVHKAKILHRDVKPENLFLVDTPEKSIFVKLMDFGVAKGFGGREEARLTAVGMTVGTPEFMAPEQLLGHELDERTDIYGLGIALYDMLTGAPPLRLEGDYGEFVLRKVKEPPPPIASRPPAAGKPVPAALEAVVMRCIDQDRANRFQSALELRDALQASLGGQLATPAVVAPPPVVAPVVRDERLSTMRVRTGLPGWAKVILLLIIAGAAAAAGTVILRQRSTGPGDKRADGAAVRVDAAGPAPDSRGATSPATPDAAAPAPDQRAAVIEPVPKTPPEQKVAPKKLIPKKHPKKVIPKPHPVPKETPKKEAPKKETPKKVHNPGSTVDPFAP